MKTITSLTIALLLLPLLFFSQEDMSAVGNAHKTEVFLEQNLIDFNAKYHSAFISGYQDFKNITGTLKDQNTPNHFTSSIDFEHGLNESIHLNKSDYADYKLFMVDFECEKDETIGQALYNAIIERILTVSPKGFVQSSKTVDNKAITTIQFDPKEADKAAHQPTTKVVFDYTNLTIQVIISTPKIK